MVEHQDASPSHRSPPHLLRLLPRRVRLWRRFTPCDMSPKQTWGKFCLFSLLKNALTCLWRESGGFFSIPLVRNRVPWESRTRFHTLKICFLYQKVQFADLNITQRYLNMLTWIPDQDTLPTQELRLCSSKYIDGNTSIALYNSFAIDEPSKITQKSKQEAQILGGFILC